MTVSRLSVRPTAAMASAPSFDTQKMSAIANTDSITISSTMGMASRKTARPSGSAVRSWRDPRSASRTMGQKRAASARVPAVPAVPVPVPAAISDSWFSSIEVGITPSPFREP